MVNTIQNGKGLSERTNIKKLKLGTKLSKQINNTSLTFEKKEQIATPYQALQCMNSK